MKRFLVSPPSMSALRLPFRAFNERAALIPHLFVTSASLAIQSRRMCALQHAALAGVYWLRQAIWDESRTFLPAWVFGSAGLVYVPLRPAHLHFDPEIQCHRLLPRLSFYGIVYVQLGEPSQDPSDYRLIFTGDFSGHLDRPKQRYAIMTMCLPLPRVHSYALVFYRFTVVRVYIASHGEGCAYSSHRKSISSLATPPGLVSDIMTSIIRPNLMLWT